MSPTFSIIIPVYNVAPYLRECLDSVMAQTYTDWEAICVDDGSTDGSGAILDEYAATDHRFHVIHQTNAGVSAARNAALDVAQGEWIGFLDADDMIMPNRLAVVAAVFDRHEDVDVIRTGWTRCRGDQRTPRTGGIADGVEARVFDSVDFFWNLISRCSYVYLQFIKRGVLFCLRFPQGVRIREDALFLFEFAIGHPRLLVLEDVSYLRCEREGSAVFQSRRRNDTICLLSRFVELCRANVKMVRKCRASSTFWVMKDVREWFAYCPSRKISDSVKVWKLVFRLFLMGVINPLGNGHWQDRIKNTGYLCTGLGRFLLLKVRK